jgi:hypothetical protein
MFSAGRQQELLKILEGQAIAERKLDSFSVPNRLGLDVPVLGFLPNGLSETPQNMRRPIARQAHAEHSPERDVRYSNAVCANQQVSEVALGSLAPPSAV